MNKRTHVVIPEQLVKDIDTLVGSRQRSTFLTQAAEEKLMRYRQLKAIEAAAGAWKEKDHPELEVGAAKYISKLRRQDEKRFQKVTTRSR
jgi:metal-responsive CopG/Arc/MetJ family transcriptional regulator